MIRTDAHHHLWELGRRPQAWLDSPEMAPIRRDFTLTDLAAGRPGLSAQSFGGALDTTRCLAVKLAELPQRCRAESQLVASAGHSSSVMPSSAQTASAGMSSPGSAMAASAAAMSAASSPASIPAAS
jgi:L-fuconolactonase